MKFAYLKTLVIVKLIIHCGLASAEQLSAHEYAEKTHNNIIEIIQTKNQLFLDNQHLL